MKKRILIIILTLILVVNISGCVSSRISDPPSAATEEYSYIPSTAAPYIEVITVTEPVSILPSTTEYISVPYTQPTTEAPLTTVVEPATVPEPTTVIPTESSTSEPTTESETTSAPPSTKPSAPESTTVDLSIELPEANGTMKVDSSPENKYIKVVVSKRNVDASLLVAVFSVPESGQNYVLEFNEKNSRSKDDLRRVFLLDNNGTIMSVAAAKASEKENVTSTENWFCFNVLIKGVIFDAIADEL